MIKYASAGNGFLEVSFWSNLLTVVFLLPTLPLFIKDAQKTALKSYSGIALTTILWTIGFLFLVKALAENISITSAIMSVPLSMLFVMILAIVSPKLLEKHTPKVYFIRKIAAVVMFVAALGLSG